MKQLKRVVRLVPYVPVLWSLRFGPGHGLFDRDYYRASCPGLFARLFPLLHFLVAGGFEGRNPHPLFDTRFYLARYADVREARVNPLLHFVRHGAAEGRKPHPLFQPDYYLRRYPEARRAGANPLIHFLRGSGAHSASPHPLFDGQCYLDANPNIAAKGVNPLVDYALFEGRPGTAFEGTCQTGGHLEALQSDIG